MKICKRCENLCDISFFKISKKTGKLLNPCLNCIKILKNKDRVENKERDNLAKKKWADRNIDKVKASKKKWKEENIGKVKADKAARKERVARATPNWLTPLQKEAINLYYMMADLRTKMFGIKYEVDHIVPLRGKNICGLHVPWNLEVVSAKDNNKKSNKMVTWAKSSYIGAVNE